MNLGFGFGFWIWTAPIIEIPFKLTLFKYDKRIEKHCKFLVTLLRVTKYETNVYCKHLLFLSINYL